MGLQRIFSATTAVVGLFISVDYGLCDEFRCRGKDIVTSDTKVKTGWQDRAVWTLMYVIGIALWTLHLSLLEGYVVTLPGVSIQFVLLNLCFITSNFSVSLVDQTKSATNQSSFDSLSNRIAQRAFITRT